MIASCGFEIKFHDWETCICAATYTPPIDTISPAFHDISWSSDGTLLAAVPISGRSIILRPHLASPFRSESTLVSRETIEVASVKCARFPQTDGPTITLGTSSGHVLHYNYKTKSANVLIDDLPASVNFLEYGASDRYMVAGCANGQIFQLEPGLGITASYFVPHSNVLTCLAVHPVNSKFLAGGSERGVIAVWDINTSCCMMRVSQNDGVLQDVGFSPSDDTLATIGADNKVYIYDLRTTSSVHEKQFDVRLTSMVYCPDGHGLAVATDRGYIFCLDKRYLKTTRSGVNAHDSAIRKMRFQRPVQNSMFGGLSISERGTHQVIPTVLSRVVSTQPKLPPASSNDTKLTDKCAMNKMDDIGLAYNRPSNANDLSMFHIINETHLTKLREDVMNTTKEIVNQVLENMNVEFLKMRMAVSREFCMVETRNKARWQEFNDTLIRLAYLDDQRHDSKEPDDKDAHTNSITDQRLRSEDNCNTLGDLALSELVLNRENDTENDMYDIDFHCDTASEQESSHKEWESVKRKSRFSARLSQQKSNILSMYQDGVDDIGD